MSTRVTGDVVHRYAAVQALWFAVQNDPDHSIADLATEFYSAVSYLFEGVPLEQLKLLKIDKERALRHLKEG